MDNGDFGAEFRHLPFTLGRVCCTCSPWERRSRLAEFVRRLRARAARTGTRGAARTNAGSLTQVMKPTYAREETIGSSLLFAQANPIVPCRLTVVLAHAA